MTTTPLARFRQANHRARAAVLATMAATAAYEAARDRGDGAEVVAALMAAEERAWRAQGRAARVADVALEGMEVRTK